MQGRNAVGAVISALMLVRVGMAWAGTQEETAPAALSPSVVERPVPRQQTEMEKLREALRAKLDGTKWALELRPMEGTGKIKQDAVSFTGRTVTSERLAKLGYPASNYSLNAKEDRTATWETMQTKAGEGVAFWRGELEGEMMRGVLSQQPANGPGENYSFVGKQTGGAALTTPAPAPAAAGVELPAPAASPTVEQAPTPTPPTSPVPSVSVPESASAPAVAPALPQPAPTPAPEAAKKKKKGWVW